MREPILSALTRSSTERVDTPWMQASSITAESVFSAVRRGSRNSGKSLPWRSLGILSSTLWARVSQARSR